MSGEVVAVLIGVLLLLSWGAGLVVFAWEARGPAAQRLLRRGIVSLSVISVLVSICLWCYLGRSSLAPYRGVIERLGFAGMLALGGALATVIMASYWGAQVPFEYALALLSKGQERAQELVEREYRKLQERTPFHTAVMLASALLILGTCVFLAVSVHAIRHGVGGTVRSVLQEAFRNGE